MPWAGTGRPGPGRTPGWIATITTAYTAIINKGRVPIKCGNFVLHQMCGLNFHGVLDVASREIIAGADIDALHDFVTGIGALRRQEVDVSGQGITRMVRGSAEWMGQAD